MICLCIPLWTRFKGEYKTNEEKGSKDAENADMPIVSGKTGQPAYNKKKEWLI